MESRKLINMRTRIVHALRKLARRHTFTHGKAGPARRGKTQVALACLGWLSALTLYGAQSTPQLLLLSDVTTGNLTFLLDHQPALTYHHGPTVDLPHFYPVTSPTGKLLTVQQTEPYPHHRSLWFADAVKFEGGRRVSFYDALYTRVNTNDPASPCRDRIRHLHHTVRNLDAAQALVEMQLLWEMDLTTPVLDESRQVRLVALPDREYFLDLTFTLTASHGDVEFVSDWVHYAWPFIRMHPQFSVDHGGRITSSTGAINQEQTNGQPARWIDYSTTIDGTTEGLAVFSHPQNPAPHKWLTRDYGTFGPRRPDARSGVPFTLQRGESITQRVGILVHRGDVASGQVAERFERYAAGNL
jgi:hypothetical protein